MLTISRQPIPQVVQQHAEEAAILRNIRSELVSAPHVKLHHLQRLDERIAAHLDGLAVAGEFGWKLCEAALETPGVGELFAATVRAIEDKNSAGLDKLLALAEAVPESQPGLTSAFGWVSAQFLQGTIKNLLASSSAFQRQVGIAACAMHRVEPGAVLNAAISSPYGPLCARGLRCAGEVGQYDLLAVCVGHLKDEDPACAFWAAWSATLLGNRGAAVESLRPLCLSPGPHRDRALQHVLKILNNQDAHALLKALSADPANQRTLIQGAGIAGDTYYVPWLIKQMEDPRRTRLAGESFSFITGLDLAYLDLERKPPEDFEPGPTDNPDDPDVSMDPDDSLPWPDPEKIRKWWDANQHRFQDGVRYFMGAPVTREHCMHVLKEGYQRQRIAAGQYLCLLDPGTNLFPTSAPAWRQQRWLAEMT